MTAERFRDEMRTLDVWPSNSMIAAEDGEPIGVLIGTKREVEVLVLRLGVAPGHERQGHGSHLVTSLSQKLAVLGPERLVVEVPERLEAARRFFESLGWTPEDVLVDWSRSLDEAREVPSELVVPIQVERLVSEGHLETSPAAAWSRQRRSLLNRKEEVAGWAVASPERLEAYALVMPCEDRTEVLHMGTGDGERAHTFLRLLCDALATRYESPLVVPRLAPGEWSEHELDGLGFRPGDRYHRLATAAEPL